MTEESIDPLSAAALRLAEGEEVDWAETLDLSPQSEQVIANLRRLEQVFSAFSEAREEGDAQAEAPRTLFRWGHLEARERIGAGSFGEVFRAYDPTLDREVALKLRLGTAREGPDESRSYILEARRLARVRHRHVLAVHGADVHDGRVGLWADLLDGQTLEQLIDEQAPLSADDVVQLGLDLAHALHEVHEAGLVHGDVKGSNVMLEPKLGPVLMDFGAGIDISSGESETVVGSPLSMAPEQFEQSSATPRSDQYSLGVLLYRLLTGSYPLNAESIADLAARHRSGERRLSFPSMVPRPLRRLVSALLAQDPGSRPSAEQTAERLAWIAAAPARRRRASALSVIFISLLAGTIAATFGYLRAQRSETRALSAQAETAAVNEFLVDMLSSPRPTVTGGEVKMVDVLDAAESKVEAAFADQPLARSQALGVLGVTWKQLIDYERAEPLLRRGLELRIAERGDRDPGVLDLQWNLAAVMRERGQLDDAEQLLQTVLANEDVVPTDDDLRLNVRLQMARLARARGDIARAQSWLEQALEWRRDEGSRLHSERRVAESELGRILSMTGQFEPAAELLEDLLPRQLETDGERHGNTLVVLHDLGRALTGLGRYQEAESMLQRGLDVASEWLGENSRHAQAQRVALATLYFRQSRYSDAATLHRQVLDGFRQTESRPSPDLLSATGNLGTSLLESGDVEEGRAPARQSSRDGDGRLWRQLSTDPDLSNQSGGAPLSSGPRRRRPSGRQPAGRR